MSGHSKWASIKHSKGKADKKRSKIFSKLSKEISVAAKLGDKDPDMNPRLRSAIQAARSANMPKDNIERAVDKSSTNTETNFENIRYEGFGPDKIAVIVEALTDNRNRTASDVRTAFAKNGGNLAETGAVSFMFDRMGSFHYPLEIGSADDIFEIAIEAGAEDIESGHIGHDIYCQPADFHKLNGRVIKFLIDHGYKGGIYPVNPKYDMIGTLTCYPTVDDLPAVVDLAVIAVPAKSVNAAVAACSGIPNYA